MQLHWGWAVLGVVLVGAALIWLTQPDNQLFSMFGHSQPAIPEPQGPAASGDNGPTLYRWIDAGGVVNISDHPPAGRRYSIVHIRPDQNVVPMSTNHSYSDASTSSASTAQ